MRPDLPFVSVIVATFERPRMLAACLDRLSRVDYPPDRFEIVVVDDGGQTSLVEICAASGGGPAVRLFRQPNRGAAAARNLGAASARGEFLLFTDDDCFVETGWIRALAETLAESPDAVVGGRTVNALGDNPFSTASQLLVNWVCARPEGGPQPGFANGNNLAVTRTAFEAVGGFDARFTTSAGEDREFTGRFRFLGRPVRFNADAVVEHANPLTWRSFVRQHLNYGRAAYHLRASPSPRTSPPPLGSPAFYLRLVAMPLDQNATGGRIWLGPAVRSLLVVAQLATAAGFLAEWMRPRVGSPVGTRSTEMR